MPKRTIKELEGLVGKLGTPSKMPGFSYGLPASDAPWVPSVCKQLGLPVPKSYGCPIGSKLAQQKNTVCSKCYATKGFYVFSAPKAAQVRRLVSLEDPDWVDNISELIERKGGTHFRWHDSGDLLGRWHLDKIVEVAKKLPTVSFWLPTREANLIKQYQSDINWNFGHPSNLVIRVSSHKINQEQLKGFKNTSTVHSDRFPWAGHLCPAPQQGNQCGTCRACWRRDVQNVSYKLH